MGSCDTPYRALDVDISGDFAYVADGYEGLQVINIADPENPRIIGSFDTQEFAGGVSVARDFAYVAAGFPMNLIILDISDPTFPEERGHISQDEWGFSWDIDIEVIVDIAYIACDNENLRVVDVSDPAHPREIGISRSPRLARSLVCSGNWAYVSDFSFGIRVIDISNPEEPVERGTCDIPEAPLGIDLTGNLLLVAD